MSILDINYIKSELESRGIRPSFQRLKVLEYLHQHKNTHPTAEEIFAALSPEIPTLSRATVYNTLHSFIEHGLIDCMSLDGIETRYDMKIDPHGHFKCEICGVIRNFPIRMEDMRIKELEHYQINHRKIIFTGICPDCTNQIKSEKGEL